MALRSDNFGAFSESSKHVKLAEQCCRCGSFSCNTSFVISTKFHSNFQLTKNLCSKLHTRNTKILQQKLFLSKVSTLKDFQSRYLSPAAQQNFIPFAVKIEQLLIWNENIVSAEKVFFRWGKMEFEKMKNLYKPGCQHNREKWIWL